MGSLLIEDLLSKLAIRATVTAITNSIFRHQHAYLLLSNHVIMRNRGCCFALLVLVMVHVDQDLTLCVTGQIHSSHKIIATTISTKIISAATTYILLLVLEHSATDVLLDLLLPVEFGTLLLQQLVLLVDSLVYCCCKKMVEV